QWRSLFFKQKAQAKLPGPLQRLPTTRNQNAAPIKFSAWIPPIASVETGRRLVLSKQRDRSRSSVSAWKIKAMNATTIRDRRWPVPKEVTSDALLQGTTAAASFTLILHARFNDRHFKRRRGDAEFLRIREGHHDLRLAADRLIGDPHGAV